ncbi:MAG: SpoIIIAH-like family protein [Desulfitobacteriaceae bacterium]|nr:SpoIIIAH-like family protein [Desulfitobacteriaceae bacterium]MDD4346106.1 SpoIIIAH-like family protein [Desulfitobacteriaceae bacterium]MDD4401066.1 SpoIIIAH-like family protein [Desulfitobacteriaceae bacterium]
MFRRVISRLLTTSPVHKLKLKRGFFLTSIFLPVIMLFFCLGLSFAESPRHDKLLAEVQMPETNIYFQAEKPDASSQGEEYFVNYRLRREHSRQEIKSMLEEILNSASVQIREEAQGKWLKLGTEISQENELENLLKIRGFQDVIADVNYGSVNIIILSQGLTPYEIFLTQDTVNQITGICPEKVFIEIKK